MSAPRPRAVPVRLLRDPLHLLAFGFGTGLAPRAPGTFGTLAGVAIYLPMATLAWWPYLLAVTLMFAAGVWLCGRAARALHTHDHPGIVWDEVVGYLVTMLAAPPGWPWLLAGFVAFRVLDILKPWPVGLADRRVGGGLGIMLDDLLAGLIGAALLAAGRLSIPA